MTRIPPPFTGGPFEYGTQVRVTDGNLAGQVGTVVGNIQDVIIEVQLDDGTIVSLVPEEITTR